MNKTIQDLTMEVKAIKKSQRETALEIEILGKRSGVIDKSITNRMQEIEERISGAEDTGFLTQNIQEIKDTMRRPNLRIIGIAESDVFQLKEPVNIFNKIIEEKFPKERDAHKHTRSLQNSK